jgi:hypothetical protein
MVRRGPPFRELEIEVQRLIIAGEDTVKAPVRGLDASPKRGSLRRDAGVSRGHHGESLAGASLSTAQILEPPILEPHRRLIEDLIPSGGRDTRRQVRSGSGRRGDGRKRDEECEHRGTERETSSPTLRDPCTPIVHLLSAPIFRP